MLARSTFMAWAQFEPPHHAPPIAIKPESHLDTTRPMLRYALTLALVMSLTSATAQDTTLHAPPDFDFWLGEWSATWEGGNGTNTVTRELNGHVVHEHFADPGSKFNGESWTVYDHHLKRWRQTWVDDGGGYMTFEGGPTSEGVTLYTRMPDKTGATYLYHMVFHNITPKAFDWTWKRSPDDGRTWEVKWAIHYTRK